MLPPSPWCNSKGQDNNKVACCLRCFVKDLWSVVERLPVQGSEVPPTYPRSPPSIQVLQGNPCCGLGESVPHDRCQGEGSGRPPVRDDVSKKDPEMCVHRFARVVFGVSSSPFLLNATVKYHLERYLDLNEATVKHLLQSTYVDDIISGANTVEEAFELYTQSKELFRQGGFNLRKVRSNSQPLQTRLKDCWIRCNLLRPQKK